MWLPRPHAVPLPVAAGSAVMQQVMRSRSWAVMQQVMRSPARGPPHTPSACPWPHHAPGSTRCGTKGGGFLTLVLLPYTLVAEHAGGA